MYLDLQLYYAKHWKQTDPGARVRCLGRPGRRKGEKQHRVAPGSRGLQWLCFLQGSMHTSNAATLVNTYPLCVDWLCFEIFPRVVLETVLGNGLAWCVRKRLIVVIWLYLEVLETAALKWSSCEERKWEEKCTSDCFSSVQSSSHKYLLTLEFLQTLDECRMPLIPRTT